MILYKKPSLETLATWEDIRISRKEDLLILENSRIRRTYRFLISADKLRLSSIVK